MEQLGKYGFLRRDYLKNHRNSTYQVMLLQDTIGEHVFISKYDMTGIRKGSLVLAEQVMSISTKCIIEKCGRVNKWSLDRVLKAVRIQMGMEGEGHDGRGI